MIKINFKRLAITNFLSIGETPVVIDFTPGIHIITGRNVDKPDRRNMIGKSSIIRAFYYAIIGEDMFKTKKELISNNITNKGGKVSLTFDVVENDKVIECKIDRSVKPAKCNFIVDGVDKTRDSITNTTLDICKMLRITSEILKNCVIMSMNNSIPFMLQSKNDKREFIEHIFRLEVFNDMFADAKTEYNTYKKEVDVQERQKNDTELTIKSYKVKQEQAYSQLQDKIVNLQQSIENNQKTIADYQQKILDFKLPDAVNDCEQQIQQLKNKQNSCHVKLNEYSVELGKFDTVLSQLMSLLYDYNSTKTVCPTCNRPFDNINAEELEQLKKTTEEKIKNNKSECNIVMQKISKVNEAIKLIEKKIQQINKLDKQYKDALHQVDLWKSKIEQYESNNQSIYNTIETLKQSSIQTYDELIDELNKKLSDINKNIVELKDKLYIAEMVKYITSEEGVKAYLIKKIIEVFNTKIDYYVKKLDGNGKVSFNEFFDETIVNYQGKQCAYTNFSGAEQKSIDLACLFTFMDMRSAQGNVSYNVSFYDELFDSSLDAKGIEKVVEVLTERVNNHNECAYVVTHRQEMMQIATGDTVFLEKKNGITTRVES